MGDEMYIALHMYLFNFFVMDWPLVDKNKPSVIYTARHCRPVALWKGQVEVYFSLKDFVANIIICHFFFTKLSINQHSIKRKISRGLIVYYFQSHSITLAI
jgi:hypothetical protein